VGMDERTNAPEELLDLVNEADEVIGVVKRGEANQDPKLLHREVAVIIYDDKGRVLFQQRSKRKLVNPGIWTESCAGHVPKGMSPKVAAHRELKEELGFDTKLEFVEKSLARRPNETHLTYWFIGKFPRGAKVETEPAEVEQVRFLSERDLEKLVNSGEKYDPVKYGGHPKDMIKEFWRGKLSELVSKP
jgi:isopentenyl-diphosphate delta-isomerase